MDAPLLATKFYAPPLRPDLVGRPRLIRRLEDGLCRGGDGPSSEDGDPDLRHAGQTLEPRCIEPGGRHGVVALRERLSTSDQKSSVRWFAA